MSKIYLTPRPRPPPPPPAELILNMTTVGSRHSNLLETNELLEQVGASKRDFQQNTFPEKQESST
jgi:hypothetical protein